MNIILSQRIGLNQHGIPVDSLESDYIKFFSSFGFNCFPVSNFSPDVFVLAEQLEINGIVLTGGNDIYEENDYIKYRNNIEILLIQFALKNTIPLLGICRGMQFIHFYFGGRLKGTDDHTRKNHQIIISPSRFYDETYHFQEVLVNSYHSKLLDESTLSSEFAVAARCKVDDAAESIIHKQYPLLGIMWHPERGYLEQDALFNKNLIQNFFNKIKI